MSDEENGKNSNCDTGEMDLQQIILDELHTTRGVVEGVATKMAQLEESITEVGQKVQALEQKTDRAITDLHMVHAFHRSYIARLQAVEKVCSEMPLKSVRPTPPAPSSGGSGGDGRLGS